MKKKILFIDRDGTLIIEPIADAQLDSFDKLEFYPNVFEYLKKINQLDYDLVMVTNQDGLGTSSFPEDTFWPVHNFMLSSFKNEGIIFSEVFIDKSLPHENAPTRKPQTGMLRKYIDNPQYDLSQSYVIGDRLTDVALAKNLGAKAILINENLDIAPQKDIVALQTSQWKVIYELLKAGHRSAEIRRKTNETDITIKLSLEGTGQSNISTGLHFFNHMLEQIARHGQIDLEISAKGDLHIDEHHTVEDIAITLGEVFYKAIIDKHGMERYGFCLPMDDALAQVAIDFGGRSWLVWDVDFKRERIGDVSTEMFEHFFKSFADSARANINIKATGKNEHHKIESVFKAFAKAIKMAIKRDLEKMILPSTKGVL